MRDIQNFNIGNLPPKSFSVYGSKSNLKNIDKHNSGKKETLSEISQALELARNFHKKQHDSKQPIQSNKIDGFTKLGSEERNEIIQSVNSKNKPQKIKTIKTDEEIKEAVEKAKEQNKTIGLNFNTNSSTSDILSGILNDLF